MTFIVKNKNVCVSRHLPCNYPGVINRRNHEKKGTERTHFQAAFFMSEFNSQKEMEEQLALYFLLILRIWKRRIKEYISKKKYMNIMNHTYELDAKLNGISMGWKTRV